MTRILVTGAAGFIGRHVVNFLARINDVQVVASSRSNSRPDFFSSEIEFIQFDYNNDYQIDLMKYFGYPEIVIHLAWGGLPHYQDNYHYSIELPLQKKFCQNLISNGCRNMSVIGTCLEYGMREGVQLESDEVAPDSAYAIAKVELYNFLLVLQKDYSFQLKWLRLYYMFGEGQNNKSILPLLQSSIDAGQNTFDMSSGSQMRDYLPVVDVANYIGKVAFTDTNGIINVCSGQPISVLDLVTNYLHQTKQNISLNLGVYQVPSYEPFAFWGSNTKLKKLINKE